MELQEITVRLYFRSLTSLQVVSRNFYRTIAKQRKDLSFWRKFAVHQYDEKLKVFDDAGVYELYYNNSMSDHSGPRLPRLFTVARHTTAYPKRASMSTYSNASMYFLADMRYGMTPEVLQNYVNSVGEKIVPEGTIWMTKDRSIVDWYYRYYGNDPDVEQMVIDVRDIVFDSTYSYDDQVELILWAFDDYGLPASKRPKVEGRLISRVRRVPSDEEYALSFPKKIGNAIALSKMLGEEFHDYNIAIFVDCCINNDAKDCADLFKMLKLHTGINTYLTIAAYMTKVGENGYDYVLYMHNLLWILQQQPLTKLEGVAASNSGTIISTLRSVKKIADEVASRTHSGQAKEAIELSALADKHIKLWS